MPQKLDTVPCRPGMEPSRVSVAGNVLKAFLFQRFGNLFPEFRVVVFFLLGGIAGNYTHVRGVGHAQQCQAAAGLAASLLKHRLGGRPIGLIVQQRRHGIEACLMSFCIAGAESRLVRRRLTFLVI
jgi:hypothetical protein